MATAICSSCGKTVLWRATRGARLADHRCACGGALQSKTAGQPGRSGYRMVRCDYCHRRRKDSALVMLPAPVWLIGAHVPAGSRVCRWHEVAEPGGEAYATQAPLGIGLINVGELLAGKAQLYRGKETP